VQDNFPFKSTPALHLGSWGRGAATGRGAVSPSPDLSLLVCKALRLDKHMTTDLGSDVREEVGRESLLHQPLR
jgi:hypothetical protein